jgi:hypothetical protein
MTIRFVILSLLILTFATALVALPAENSAIIGVWQGKWNSLPLITLTISDESGKLTGAVLFYLIQHNPGTAPSAGPGIPEPLIDPSFDGKTFTYKVSHRHAHKGSEHDPPVSFRMELTGADRAKAFGPEGVSVEMVRESPY